MASVNVLILSTLPLFTFVNTTLAQSEDFYTRAVVDYSPYFDSLAGAQHNLKKNLDEYISYIRKAKHQNADIIVFPECGITSLYFPRIDKNKLSEYASEVPDSNERVIPCGTHSWTETITHLSCAAKENQIYVVVNLPERYKYQGGESESNVIYYNTNVVFDRTGAIIARYRKYNLYGEKQYNRTEIPEEISFETDFGVTFGTFICFDILFAEPAAQLLKHNPHVTDIVYPLAWFSELPFLSAVQTQYGWARANGVNLLAAGYNEPAIRSGGSGIYPARGDLKYIMPTRRQSQLIVQRIPKIKQRLPPGNNDASFTTANSTLHTNEPKHFTNEIMKSAHSMYLKRENISLYTTALINNTNIENSRLCYGEFCCVFTIKFLPEVNVDYRYRIVAYEGSRLFDVEDNDVQICGLVACTNEAVESCGVRNDNLINSKVFTEVSITGNFKNDDETVVFPSNTLYDLTILPPSNFKYTVTPASTYNTVQMKSTQQVDSLLAFGIYGVTKTANKYTPSVYLVGP